MAVPLLGGVLLVRQSPMTSAHASMVNERSSYLVVAGASGQGDDQVLWILDTRAEELAVAGFDSGVKAMRGFGTRSIQADLDHARRSR